MKEYHKIQSIFKRDEKTHKFIESQYSLPEFEYLKNNLWQATEKINGTNIRIGWDYESQIVEFSGRSDNAQTPTFLLTKLQEMFPKDKFFAAYPDTSMVLYGEGYGARIQKGGGNYNPNGADFILFDVLIDNWWLRWDDVQDIAAKLGIATVPVIGEYSLIEAVELIKRKELKSTFGNFLLEGLVLKPIAELFNRHGERIITKIKHVDF